MVPHPVKNFETRGYYQNKARSDGVYSRDNIQKKGWVVYNKT